MYEKVYGNDKYVIKEWFDENKKLHRDDGPAEIWFHENKKHKEVWYQHGEEQRTDGPSMIEYYENETIKFKQFCYKEKDGFSPSWISYYKNGNKKEEGWERSYKTNNGELIRRTTLPLSIEYFEKHKDHIKHEFFIRENRSLPSHYYYYEDEFKIKGPIKRLIWMENFYYNEYDLDISYYKNGGRSKEHLLGKVGSLMFHTIKMEIKRKKV